MGTEQTFSKKLEGVVISNKMQKTLVVAVQRLVSHPRYEKQVKRTTKLHVHDEEGIGEVGDRAIIAPCRPYSKTKSWALVSLIRKAGS